MSQLMFWNKQNNNNNNNTNTNSATDGKNGKRNWLHAPDALLNGHVVYLVKFFGNLSVEQVKGIEVVKDAIRKLQFAQQIKKAETGTQEKLKKVEITISVDGVAIQEPRTQKILYQFPLHNISYCADEKGVKKFFSFIAKPVKSTEANNESSGTECVNMNGSSNAIAENHECFVFISNKLASDITLTIGQAFDLAFRKYMNNTEKTDLSKAQQQVAELEKTIAIYRNRLRDLATKLTKPELDAMLYKMGISDILDVPSYDSVANCENSTKLATENILIDANSNQSNRLSSNNTIVNPLASAPAYPARSIANQIATKSTNQKMEELLLNSDSDSDFDPRANECSDTTTTKSDSSDLFGFEPAKTYGQQLFYNNNNNKFRNYNDIGNSGNNSFTNELTMTPPLIAPPPKLTAPRRNTQTTNANINLATNNSAADLFGSDPFSLNEPTIFKTGNAGGISVDDFSLDSLDPLKK